MAVRYSRGGNAGLTVSVVIPSYQRCHLLRRTLQCLARQTLNPAAYEVIVSIDGSEDGSREMAEHLSLPYQLTVLWQENQGRASACNAGLARTRGEVVVILDDDMEPSPQFLAAHLREHAGGGRRAVVGAAPVVTDRGTSPAARYMIDKFNRHIEHLSRMGRPHTLRDVYTGNFSIPRDLLLEVGGYDPSFGTYGNEDLELAVRLAAAGVSIGYSSAAVARQQYTKRFIQIARDTLAKGRTAVLLARKHPSVAGQLQLSQYHAASPQWKVARSILLGLSRRSDRVALVIARLLDRVVRLAPGRLHCLYSLGLDYLYWSGAFAALEHGMNVGGRDAD